MAAFHRVRVRVSQAKPTAEMKCGPQCRGAHPLRQDRLNRLRRQHQRDALAVRRTVNLLQPGFGYAQDLPIPIQLCVECLPVDAWCRRFLGGVRSQKPSNRACPVSRGQGNPPLRRADHNTKALAQKA